MVLQGSPDGILDDLKRAVDDGVNTYKVSLLTNDENTPPMCRPMVGYLTILGWLI